MIFATLLLQVPPGSGRMFTKGGRKNGKNVVYSVAFHVGLV